MPRQLYTLTCLLILLLLSRCAQILPLSGGEQDRTPPKLVEATPANESTSFNAGLVTLRFDEYVQLKDLNNQLMVSPRLKTPAEVSAEGKNIQVRFKQEELAPNTTYRIDFGKAIADMNESNSLQGFSYVFSTGPHIDSLRLGGAVRTASNNVAFGGALVALYKRGAGAALSDSLPMKEPPDYSTRTTDDGGYRIINLPAGDYNLYAFHDNNRNNLYDGETEKVAFMSQDLRLKNDTGATLFLFTEEPKKLFVKRAFSPVYGLANVVLNKKVYSTVKVSDRTKGTFVYELNEGKQKDTVALLYHDISDTLLLTLEHPEYQQTDTVRIILPERRINRKRLRSMMTNAAGGILPIDSDLEITFPVWMDTSSHKAERLKITSADDSLFSQKPFELKWKDVRTLIIRAPWKEGASYKLKGDTGMVYDLDGVSNDTVPLTIRRQSSADLSKLTLKVVLNKKQAYVVQLLSQQDQVVQQRSFALSLSSSNAVSLEFNGIAPGTYRAKIIYDDNANGKWDTGNLLRRMQPERVIIHTRELKLLADWEIEEEVQVKE
jgi:uncharacterized protein (DUF2141 family)